MLLAGDDSATTNQGLVKLLAPPPGASVGDRYATDACCGFLSRVCDFTCHFVRVYLEGQQPNEPAASLNHKQWGKVVPHFSVTGTQQDAMVLRASGRVQQVFTHLVPIKQAARPRTRARRS